MFPRFPPKAALGTPLRVCAKRTPYGERQMPRSGNPPAALVSPQRTGSSAPTANFAGGTSTPKIRSGAVFSHSDATGFYLTPCPSPYKGEG
ncbi:hypothetical protein DP115_29815 [Brasilonema octagenarum UFV-OR1]|uniref:Uncharacterized protein n=1 Tax=Brasilonema octagenarum UFV-OR1 TaxID=417115 RepID=A0ABX1MLJ1_9CYAN|nr:hypothetical protein [Brasilonema octagenarum UFV-OR1]